MVSIDLQRRLSWLGTMGAHVALAWHRRGYVLAAMARSVASTSRGVGISFKGLARETLPLRLQGRELLLIIDPTGYWYASLPQSVLGALDFRGRYTTASMGPYILGAFFGALVLTGLILAFLTTVHTVEEGLILDAYVNKIKVVVALFFGVPIGGIVGFVLGGKSRAPAMWVVRRAGGQLQAVVPKAMLTEYAEEAKRVQVYRASSLSGVVRQLDARRFYKGRRPAWQQKIEFGSMVVIIISLVGMMLFFALAVKGD